MDSTTPSTPIDEAIILLDQHQHSCGLDADQTSTRKDLLHEITSHLRSDPIPSDGSLSLQFDTQSRLAYLLLDFIIQEQQCCDFLDFDLQFRRKQLTLVISSESLDQAALEALVQTIIG
jgi:hypothetical protein